MSTDLITVAKVILAVQALKIMKDNNITFLPVTDDKRLIGAIRIQDIIGEGILG